MDYSFHRFIGNVNIIVQKTGIFHAASLAASLPSAFGIHFQLQLGMKLLPVWVS